MSVKLDIVDGATIRDSDTGIEATRIAYVDGLSGDAAARMYAAITGTPARLSAHPSIPKVKLIEKVATSISDTQATVQLIYRVPGVSIGGFSDEPELGEPAQISTGATTTSTTTQKDYAGVDMALTYSPTDAEVENGELEDLSYMVIATANIQVAQPYLRYRRRETSPPTPTAMAYVGKTNSSTFAGAPPGTLLCTNITGESSDGGDTYVVSYEFQFTNNIGLDGSNIGWDVVLRAEKDGKPQVDPVDGVHIAEFQVYQRIDFNGLGLA